MNGGVNRAELDHLIADAGDEAPVRGAAGGGDLGRDAAFGRDGARYRVNQRAARREEGLAGQVPVQRVFKAVLVENLVYAFFQARIGGGG